MVPREGSAQNEQWPRKWTMREREEEVGGRG